MRYVGLPLDKSDGLQEGSGRRDCVAREAEPIDEIGQAIALIGRLDDEFEQHDFCAWYSRL
jgi:hypothetical protein